MRGVFLVFFVFMAASAWAQKAGFTFSTDRQKIFIGEQIKLTIQADIPANATIEWPVLDSFPHFEIINKAKIDTQPSGDRWIYQQVITITSWDSGSWNLNPLPGQKLKPERISVGYSPMDPNQDYHDIKDIIEVKKPSRITWHWYLIGLALLLILLMLVFPGGKKEKKKEIITDPGAYQKALKQLEALEGKVNTDPKKFYTDMLVIFRTYLYKRKGVWSDSKTTEDLAAYLDRANLRAKDFSAALETLQVSDLARFAKYVPGEHDKREDLHTIKNTIMSLEKER